MVEDLMIIGLAEGEKKGAEYVELRYQDKYLANFQLRDGELTSTTGSRAGMCARVLVNGSWGLASTNFINKNEIAFFVKSESKMRIVFIANKISCLKHSGNFKDIRIDMFSF